VRRFQPGEAVVLREVLRNRIWVARAVTVVRDADYWMFYIPPGTQWVGPASKHERPWVGLKAPGATWTLAEHVWRSAHVLSFAWPGAGAAVLQFWDADWNPMYWYVNAEAPLRRFELGFETFDHDLDVVVEPDRSSWRWKDEDDVATGVELGAYSEDDAAAFRREAERGLRRILEREPPFDRGWWSWRPDRSWSAPALPAGWDRLSDAPLADDRARRKTEAR
jgi:Protein of unknown function (DUF402)